MVPSHDGSQGKESGVSWPQCNWRAPSNGLWAVKHFSLRTVVYTYYLLSTPDEAYTAERTRCGEVQRSMGG